MAQKSHITEQEKKLRLSAYEMYRDMARPRSYERLLKLLEPTHGVMPARRITVWSREDKWNERLQEVDRNPSRAVIVTDPNFDKTDALLRTAHLALQRVLSSTPTVVTPQDYKSLVDSSEKAIRLVLKLQELGVGDSTAITQNERSRQINWLMDKLDEKVRAAHAAQGHPIPVFHGPVIDVEADEVVITEPAVNEADTKAALQIEAPTETPLPEPQIVEKQAVVKPAKPLTTAERLRQLAKSRNP